MVFFGAMRFMIPCSEEERGKGRQPSVHFKGKKG
jgi:hypothetical protein